MEALRTEQAAKIAQLKANVGERFAQVQATNEAAMNDQRQAFEEQINSLTAERDALLAEQRAFQAAGDTAQEGAVAELKTCKEELAAYKDTQMANEERVLGLLEKIDTQQSVVSRSLEAANEAEERLKAYEEEIEALSSELGQATTKVTSSVAALAELEETKKLLEKECIALKEQLSAAEVASHEALSELQSKLATSEEEKQALEVRNSEFNDKARQWREKVKEQKAGDEAKFAAEMDTQREEMKVFTAAAEAANVSLAAKATELAQLQGTLAKVEADHATARKALSDAHEQQIAEYEAAIDELKKDHQEELEALRKTGEEETASQLEAMKATLNEEFAQSRLDLEMELSELQQQMKEQSLETGEKAELSQRKISSLEETVAVLRAELKRLRETANQQPNGSPHILSHSHNNINNSRSGAELDSLLPANSINNTSGMLMGGGGGSPQPFAAQFSPSGLGMGANNNHSLSRGGTGAADGSSQEVADLRRLVTKLRKECAELRAENEHNRRTLTEQTAQLETLLANERRNVGIEYVKNVIFQFLVAGSEDARVLMVPALVTVLEFNEKERLAIQKVMPVRLV
eukprot:GILK01016432.1.p1 GENE.GILK01016432.1~~GILK01016432.1.p1  ORF type:complete len:613 (-),score=110.23 GILK01016432.1:105-1844(-)